MKEFEELVESFKDQELVKRYQTLEQAIHQDKELLKQYEYLKELQKKLVNKQAKKQPHEDVKKEYDTLYQALLDHPLMEEYLELVEIINNDLQMIQDIIAKEINMDL